MPLPLLEHVSSLYDKVSLKGIEVICVQHLLGTTRDMFYHLLRHHDLNPEKTHLLGKCYSTHRETEEGLKELGFHLHPWSQHFDRRFGFDTYHGAACADLLDIASKNDNKSPVILVDDGGRLIAETIRRKFDRNRTIYAGIEQTSSGYNDNLKLFHPLGIYEREPDFRLINIARSEAKLTLETPFIIDSIIEEFKKKLIIHDFTPRKILIIGTGVIGSALAKKLRAEGFDVLIHDKKEHDGPLADKIRDSNIIFGTTGENILGNIEKYLQANTMLVSVSSSDREFGGMLLKEKHRGDITDCHQDLILDNGVLLLNCGFPLNFTGEEHCVPPEKIQLTRALIMAAILAGAKNGKELRGNHDLEKEVYDSIVQKFREIQGQA